MLLRFEIEVTRPYSWCVKERMKWRLICQVQNVMFNGKTSVLVTNDTYYHENYKEDIPPYGGHGS